MKDVFPVELLRPSIIKIIKDHYPKLLEKEFVNFKDLDEAVLTHDGLSLNDVWSSKSCLYIGLPVLGYPKVAKSLGKMILGDLSNAIYQKYSSYNSDSLDSLEPCAVYIDELSAVIYDGFIEILNKCRGVKMELNFAFQSPSDIEKISTSLLKQITENTSNWFIFKQRNEESASYFSKSIGTLEGKKQTTRIENGETLISPNNLMRF
ncbi:MAG: TraM recognition domain-containing protein [Bacteriovoracaceae bacterium]|nr:TraM recognition domain-containing protein [Bacteriovoracaceae bacterium]